MDFDDDFDDTEQDEEAYILSDDDAWQSVERIPKTKLYRPYGDEYLEALKKARIKQIRSQAVANELFTYVIFLVMLFIISYANRDADSFILKKHIHGNIVTKNRFDKVNNTDDWWRWAHNTLVSELKAGPLYNGQPPYGFRGYVGDLTQRMMGFATLRQIRIKRNTCRVAPEVQNLTRECAQQTSLLYEDSTDYCNAWEEETDITRDLPSCLLEEFKYSSAESLDGLPITADLDSYLGGGYVFNVKGANKDIRSKLKKLQQQHWINNQTRAVILEFATYNVNINLFAVATIAAEWIPGGGIRTYTRIDPIRLITPLSGYGVIVYICKFFFVIFILYFIVRETGNVFLKKWEYWNSYWAYVEWFIILTAISAMGFYYYKRVLTIDMLDTFSKTYGNGYMKLQHVALIDEFYGYHLGFLIFAANIKLLKILEFNNKMSLLIYTLSRCWGDLSGFLGIFFLAFASFVQMFYLILYSDMDAFKTPLRAFETCFTMMLNKFKFGTIKETSAIAAVAFFFFAVCVNWVLINVLLTIIIEGYERVKQELEGKGNDLEVIQYIKDAARSMVGIQPRPHFLQEFAPEGSRHDELVVNKEEEEGKRDNEGDDSVVKEFPEKVDEFLEYVNKIYFDGELDIKTKGDLKDGMTKRKPISTDDQPMPKEREKKKEDSHAPEVNSDRPIKSANLSMANPEEDDLDDMLEDLDAVNNKISDMEDDSDLMD